MMIRSSEKNDVAEIDCSLVCGRLSIRSIYTTPREKNARAHHESFRQRTFCRTVAPSTNTPRSRSPLSNSYTLGLSARSILIGRVNLPRGACGRGRYSGGYYGGYPHVDS